jgi:maleate isomerase
VSASAYVDLLAQSALPQWHGHGTIVQWLKVCAKLTGNAGRNCATGKIILHTKTNCIVDNIAHDGGVVRSGAAMSSPFILATITPSGNRVVEQVVQAMIGNLPGAAALFTRIPVRGDTGGVTGYNWDRMIEAAELLADADPDVICWNGTKGGTLGFDIDRELCMRIHARTGKPACTSALALLDALARLEARKISLVTPYDAAYQQKCMAAFTARGFSIVSERHAGLTDNLSYGTVPEAEIAAMTRAAVCEAQPEAVVYFCTNFCGAFVAPSLEAECGVPVLDSTALGVWGALTAAGRRPSDLQHWGRIFALGS